VPAVYLLPLSRVACLSTGVRLSALTALGMEPYPPAVDRRNLQAHGHLRWRRRTNRAAAPAQRVRSICNPALLRPLRVCGAGRSEMHHGAVSAMCDAQARYSLANAVAVVDEIMRADATECIAGALPAASDRQGGHATHIIETVRDMRSLPVQARQLVENHDVKTIREIITKNNRRRVIFR
jgi:hypothetical protein